MTYITPIIKYTTDKTYFLCKILLPWNYDTLPRSSLCQPVILQYSIKLCLTAAFLSQPNVLQYSINLLCLQLPRSNLSLGQLAVIQRVERLCDVPNPVAVALVSTVCRCSALILDRLELLQLGRKLDKISPTTNMYKVVQILSLLNVIRKAFCGRPLWIIDSIVAMISSITTNM